MTTSPRSRRLVLAGVVAVPVVALGLAAFQPWKLFVDKTVNEALPSSISTTAMVEKALDPAIVDNTADAALLDKAVDPAMADKALDPAMVDKAADPAMADKALDPAMVDKSADAAATTVPPAVTSAAPAVTSAKSVITTAAPVVTTAAPVVATVKPVVTTAAPVLTTAKPVATTAKPVVTTAKPVATTAAPPKVSSGSFRSIDHKTSGTARILTAADGSKILRIENLNTDNGPDLFVYLSPASSTGSGFATNAVNLGKLKGNLGSQNYALPAGTNLDSLRSVVIWCNRFSSAFGAAPLVQSDL